MPNKYLKKVEELKGWEPGTAEKKWEEAKAIAEKEGHAEQYAYVTGVFKKENGIPDAEEFA